MKNILIGFLGATCFFLMIGANAMDTYDLGRYQAFEVDGHMYIIDTSNSHIKWKTGSMKYQFEGSAF